MFRKTQYIAAHDSFSLSQLDRHKVECDYVRTQYSIKHCLGIQPLTMDS